MEFSNRPNDDCVVIDDDNDTQDDEPGPVRIEYRPKACSYEENWFNSLCIKPQQVIDSTISKEDVECFQNIIWNSPYDRMVAGYGMRPEELAGISSDGRKGWLVTSHFDWLAATINRQQNSARCFVFDPTIRKDSVLKILGHKRQSVKVLIFVMSVGRHDNGEVFFGTDKEQGDHWSIAVLNAVTGMINYCDTLGWDTPYNFLKCIISYTKVIGLTNPDHFVVQFAHLPNYEQHECTNKCTNYPLQTCSDICGVICMICIAIAALDSKLFDLLLQPQNIDFKLYVSDPTEYGVYLRYVIISWIVRKRIDISKISIREQYLSSILSNPILKRKDNRSNTENDEPVIKRKYIPTEKIIEKNGISQCVLSSSNHSLTSAQYLKTVDEKLIRNGIDLTPAKPQNFTSNLTFNSSIEKFKNDFQSSKFYIDSIKQRSVHPFFGNFPQDQQSFGNDFCLGIQSAFQKNMMVLYGKKLLNVEFHKKSSACSFHMLVISVYLEGKYEFPVALLISTKLDDSILNRFFDALRLRLNTSLKTDTFITDCSETLYNLWCRYFPKPSRVLHHQWQVKNEMYEQLKLCKFRSGSVSSHTKRHLDVLFLLQDEEAYKLYLKALLEVLKTESLEFYLKFKMKYLDNERDQLWASCYRNDQSFQDNPFQQSFLAILEDIAFFEKGSMNRYDVFLHKILQLMKYNERKYQSEFNEIFSKEATNDITRKHSLSLQNVDIYQSPDKNEWFIRASEETESCVILDSGLEPPCLCKMICEKCKICVHQYVCSCIDYILNPSACVHIHFVHSYIKLNSSLGNSTQ